MESDDRVSHDSTANRTGYTQFLGRHRMWASNPQHKNVACKAQDCWLHERILSPPWCLQIHKICLLSTKALKRVPLHKAQAPAVLRLPTMEGSRRGPEARRGWRK
eukprot:scaffold218504_cov36-Tisochrysis_lutea.AAC.1